MKRLLGIQGNDQGHWVGNGFPVSTLFFYQQLGKEMSPFLMLDLAGPAEFPPTTERKGVGTHPHRGFETVTIVYEGEVSHKDSTGQGGTIGPGDVQWMTAGAGILHQEFHSDAFAKQGGVLQMVQLWVNLRAKDKMCAPAYQELPGDKVLKVKKGGIEAHVIAGSALGETSPVYTRTPVHYVHFFLAPHQTLQQPIPKGFNSFLYTIEGKVAVCQ